MGKDRVVKMEEYIKTYQKVTPQDLCHYFDISMSTLRRDLEALSRQDIIQKSYGNILYKDTGAKFLPFHIRSNINPQEKREACASAASLISDNDTLFIDSGSTACLLLDHLSTFKNITVVTNNLDVILKAFPMSNIQVLVLPGELNRENNSFSPAGDISTLNSFNITKAFFAASGVTIHDGFSHSSLAERPLKQAVLDKSCKRYFIVDSSKFGVKSLFHLCPMALADAICTNTAPPKDYIDHCEDQDIPLIYGAR